MHAGRADLISYGRAFIANPDLIRGFALGAPLTELDERPLLYTYDIQGYADYAPTQPDQEPHRFRPAGQG